MRTQMSLISVVVLMTAGWAVAGSVEMNPGEWEITTTVKMEGMPAVPGMPGELPPQVHKQCLTEKDVVPTTQKQAKECKVTDQKVKGNTVEWTLTCDDREAGMKGSGTGTVTYAGDSMDGAFVMKMSSEGMPEMTMNAKMKGKRLGPCTK